MKLSHVRVDSPIGGIDVVASERGVCALEFEDRQDRLNRHVHKRYPNSAPIAERDPFSVRSALDAYFRGDLSAIHALPLDVQGSPFQEEVWRALRDIAPGETLSYLRIAELVGRPSACRAVGTANGSNPVSLIIPCHRVVRNDGSLGGYAGGLDRKRALLTHEHGFAKSTTCGV